MNKEIYFFEPGDYDEIERLFLEKDSQACEDCLLGLYVWKDRYQLELLRMNSGCVLHSKLDGSYLYPMPSAQAALVLKELLKQKEHIELHRVTRQQKKEIEQCFPALFSFEEDAGSFDYLYEVETLAELRGKKLSKKRNHINSFLTSNDNWRTEKLNAKNIEECRAFAEEWYWAREESEPEMGLDSLQAEKEALMRIFEHYEQFQAEGLMLRVDGACRAFTIGQRISEHTFDVVFEKADEQIRGAYNMINREFVRMLRGCYPKLHYINRENDLDLPGLRKAKHSYMPAFLLEKYIAKT